MTDNLPTEGIAKVCHPDSNQPFVCDKRIHWCKTCHEEAITAATAKAVEEATKELKADWAEWLCKQCNVIHPHTGEKFLALCPDCKRAMTPTNQNLRTIKDLERQLTEAKQEIFDKGARIGGLRIDVAALEHRLSDLRESSKALVEALEKVRETAFHTASCDPKLCPFCVASVALAAYRQKWGRT